MCTQVAPIYWNLPVLAPSSQWILSPPHSTFSHVIWVLEISKCCKAELHHPSRKPVKIDTFLPAHCQNPPLCHSLSLLNTHTHTHTHCPFHLSALASVTGMLDLWDYWVNINHGFLFGVIPPKHRSLSWQLWLPENVAANSWLAPSLSSEPSCTNSPLAWQSSHSLPALVSSPFSPGQLATRESPDCGIYLAWWARLPDHTGNPPWNTGTQTPCTAAWSCLMQILLPEPGEKLYCLAGPSLSIWVSCLSHMHLCNASKLKPPRVTRPTVTS